MRDCSIIEEGMADPHPATARLHAVCECLAQDQDLCDWHLHMLLTEGAWTCTNCWTGFQLSEPIRIGGEQ